MLGRRRLVVASVVLLAAAAGFLYAETRAPRYDTISLSLVDGRRVTLGDFHGRAVLLAFWSPTCPPCVHELPALADLYRRWHRRGLELIAVSQPYDPPGQIVAIAQAQRFPYPVALDVDGRVGAAFDVDAVPRSVLIGPDGRVLLDTKGPLDPDVIATRLRQLVGAARGRPNHPNPA